MPIHLVGTIRFFLKNLPFKPEAIPGRWENLLIPLFFSTPANQSRVLKHPNPCHCYQHHFRFSCHPRRKETPIEQLKKFLTLHFVDWPATHIPFFIPVTSAYRRFEEGVVTGIVCFLPTSTVVVQITAPAA